MLITQPDHAHLARRMMEHCVPLVGHARRHTILHAVGEHDCGWEEEDAAPMVNPETGAVFDFISAPVAVRQAVWPRAVARLARPAAEHRHVSVLGHAARLDHPAQVRHLQSVGWQRWQPEQLRVPEF